VDVSNGVLLWGDHYQVLMADIFKTQEEIARKISGALQLRLDGAQQRQIAKRYTTNTEAYQLYLKGRLFRNQGKRESQMKALEFYNKAIELEPRYALAYAGIAEIYAVFSGLYLRPREAMPKAKAAALAALALDDQIAEAHYSLALIKNWGDWDWPGAEREYKRAIELNPNFTDLSESYASLLTWQMRFDEAWREVRRVEELDPLSPTASNLAKNILYHSRQYDRAIEESRQVLELHPNSAFASGTYRFLGRVYSQKQMRQEAIDVMRRAVEINRNYSNLSWLAYSYAMAGRKDEAEKILQEMKGQSSRQWVSPVSVALVYLGLGDNDRAIEWLRKGYDERSDHVLNIGVDPVYDSLRSDPRFDEMVRGIGLTPDRVRGVN
jgi:tetratricopeptide (TPR) repeat protein